MRAADAAAGAGDNGDLAVVGEVGHDWSFLGSRRAEAIPALTDEQASLCVAKSRHIVIAMARSAEQAGVTADGEMRCIIGFLGCGFSTGAWRMPGVHPAAVESVEFFEYCTQVAERGKVDAVFFADTPGLVMNEVQTTPMTTPMEPFILMTALARATERIGLIGTASTTYNDPYNLAHRIASLDLISRGRAGWNAVTTGGGLPARNFSHTEHPDHDARYARAAEFIDVVLGLWRGWEPGYHLGDKATGTFHDMGKIHELDHVGEHFQVLGPLNVPPSPQQHAVLVESGASEPGRAMAARCAEVIFASQYDIDEAIAFRTDIRRRMTANGRDPDAIKIMPGIVPVIGSTEAEAKARWRQIGELIPIEPALRFVASRFQVDPADLDLDAPLRPELLPDASQIRGSRTQYEKVVAMAIRDDLTVRELI